MGNQAAGQQAVLLVDHFLQQDSRINIALEQDVKLAGVNSPHRFHGRPVTREEFGLNQAPRLRFPDRLPGRPVRANHRASFFVRILLHPAHNCFESIHHWPPPL